MARRQGGDSRLRRAPRQAGSMAWFLQSAPSTMLDESHLRCASYGLSESERPDFSPIGRSDLAVAGRTEPACCTPMRCR